MKKYKSTRAVDKPKKHLGKRGVQAIAISASVVLVAVALTLSLTFGLKKPNETPIDDGVHVDAPPVITESIKFTAPLGECSVIKAAALNKLVYNDTLKQWRAHKGVDFEAASGSEVLSIAPGTVTDVENTILEGVVVTVAHSEGYVSVYKGLEAANVQKGDAVESGAVLGTIGTMMCEQNQGAHLHLEMKKDGAYVAATDYIEVEVNK